MNRYRHTPAAILAVFTLSSGAVEANEQVHPATSAPSTVVQKVEHALVRAADATAHGIKRGGEAAAHGIKRGSSAVGRVAKKAGEKIHHATSSAHSKTGTRKSGSENNSH